MPLMPGNTGMPQSGQKSIRIPTQRPAIVEPVSMALLRGEVQMQNRRVSEHV